MNWLPFAFLAILTLSVYNFLVKFSSPKISVFYSLPLVAIGVLVVSLLSLLFSKLTKIQGLVFSKDGALLALLIGFLWAIGQFFYFSMFAKKAPYSVGLPMFLGGLMLIGSIVGVFFFKEQLTVFKVIGILSLLIGFFFLLRV